jgi:hypothetical protein
MSDRLTRITIDPELESDDMMRPWPMPPVRRIIRSSRQNETYGFASAARIIEPWLHKFVALPATIDAVERGEPVIEFVGH